jgi:hypothetical protein
MARPIKNYCDYFPHDRDMRNHRKIKAIRTKFGIEGYAIWSMLLEYLTGIDGNVFEYSEPEFELIGGDFGVSVETIRLIIDYCIKLELLFLKDGFISSESLDERLKPVYIKRGVSKSNSQKQQRKDGKFVNNNTVTIGVSATEIPQSKVNKSKVKESKEDSGIPKKEEFLIYVEERCATVGVKYSEYKQNASVKYDAWAANGWKDLNGNKISAWKGKVVSNLQYWKSESGKPSQSGTVDLNKDFNYSNLQ